MSNTRKATHAGSWYTSNRSNLESELKTNLSKVTPLPELKFNPPVSDAKAIIAPHAGYSYSGPTAAWAYAAIPSDKVKRVFLLGPSHHTRIAGIALSPFSSYATPLGDIPLCEKTLNELEATKAFVSIRPDVDEAEHSLEMHLPYIRHIFQGRDDMKLVPLIVGQPTSKNEKQISEVLEKYWKDPETFFIVSSDFCHWGKRFNCTPYYPNAPHPPVPVPPLPHVTLPASFEPPELVTAFKEANPEVPIWQSIQYLDHEAIDHLRQPTEFGAVEKWEAYLDRTGNTICGRNPITVLLRLIQYVHGPEREGPKPEFTFVRYEQSSKCETGKDSSVSYVSGVLRMPS